jgi:hypothetical protein
LLDRAAIGSNLREANEGAMRHNLAADRCGPVTLAVEAAHNSDGVVDALVD